LNKRRDTVIRWLFRLEELIDRCARYISQRLTRRGSIELVAYLGFGTRSRWYLKGRVLRQRPMPRPSAADSRWVNAVTAVRRFGSIELPGIRVEASAAGSRQAAVTDVEGYFDIELHLRKPTACSDPWQAVQLTCGQQIGPRRYRGHATGEVLVPPADCDFGVISDVDDTIIQSDVHSRLRMAMLVLTKNARTRLAYPGVAAFYRALQAGSGAAASNPFFYVSRSPWNLYDLIHAFILHNGLPQGPLFLRDLGQEYARRADHPPRAFNYKRTRIERILAVYPQMNFILIGDSGQNDPEIYRQIVIDHPGRILAIYIRDVTASERGRDVRRIAGELRRRQVDMILSATTEAAAAHALANGWISRPANIA
jgi:phosphatidate phosphatase APP1